MKARTWAGALLGLGLLAGGLYSSPWVTFAAMGGVLLLGVLYLYFVHFGRPSEVARFTDVRDDKWHTVALGGDTSSSDGSEYAIFVRRGRSKNLLVHFSGGGACWDGNTASRPITLTSVIFGYTRELKAYYFRSLTRLFPTALSGIAAANDPRNGFADWNFVFIPYSTGDMHVGDTTNSYLHDGKTIQVHHNGRRNVLAALDWVYASFDSPEKILVAGESSGAWASAFYAPQVAAHYPRHKLYCLSDGVGLVSNRWSEICDRVWKADSAKTLGFQIGTDVFEDALVHRTDGARRNIKYLHSNTLYDDTLTRFSAALNQLPTDTTQFIEDWAANTKASMKRLSEASLDYQYFLTDWGHDTRRHTTQHTLATNEFYHRCTADGVSYSEWLKRNVIDDEALSLGGRILG